MATMQIFQIFFASAPEWVRIMLLIVGGIGGFIIGEILGSQVILRWIANQKE
ncbi:hypothetical protein ACTRXD_06460 [Nitrospira sp. T9]|uniref:hypothetical protein n=1 Tax=unclassified Nitrospira TaxID=2652172 RepID=UPI003F9BDAA8